jgi:quercetin dioxygenase-like cupin family protein
MASAPELRTNVLLRSEQSGGHVSIMENVVSPHSAGPPLHTHDFDEAFYMLEGELILQVEDERFTKRAGEFAFASRNLAHALANHTDADARHARAATYASPGWPPMSKTRSIGGSVCAADSSGHASETGP